MKRPDIDSIADVVQTLMDEEDDDRFAEMAAAFLEEAVPQILAWVRHLERPR